MVSLDSDAHPSMWMLAYKWYIFIFRASRRRIVHHGIDIVRLFIVVVAVAREAGFHADKSVPIKLVNCAYLSVDTPPDAQAGGEEGDQRR
eukprot:jgi/Psemu1/53402/gm1.53402_g